MKRDKLTLFWLILMAITLFNASIADTGSATLIITLIIALTTSYKGLVVIDNFMELKHAHIGLRWLMRLYFLLFPSLIIITFLFPEFLRQLTSIQ